MTATSAPRSYRFRPAVNRRWAAIKKQMAAIDAEFLLHGGDLTRDGETHEYEYKIARDDLDRLPFPTFVIRLSRLRLSGLDPSARKHSGSMAPSRRMVKAH